MLKELFGNRLFIGALAIFIFCVGGGLLYIRHVERQGAEYERETKARVAQWNARQPPPTAEVVAGETSQDGDFHKDGDPSPVQPPAPAPVQVPPGSVSQPAGDVPSPFVGVYVPFEDPYLEMVDGFTVTSQFAIMMAPYDIGPDWASMSAEELAAAIETINRTRGSPPPPDDDLWPPEGYEYAFGGTHSLANGDNVWLDDNGYPILTKRGSPSFDIAWVEDFRPPPDVYADYKALYELHLWSETPEEEARIIAEMDALEAMYRGQIPSGPFSGGGSRPPGMEIREYMQQFHQQFKEIEIQLKRNAYESEGIGYLMDRYSDLKPYARLETYPELKEYAK